jgi:hypothetical protein
MSHSSFQSPLLPPPNTSSVSLFPDPPRPLKGVWVSIKSLPVSDSLKKVSDHFNVIWLRDTSRLAFRAIETDFVQQMPMHDYFESEKSAKLS